MTEKNTDPNIGLKLTEALKTLLTEHTFEVGDLVQWKPGMQNRVSDGPFVVCDVLLEPLIEVEVQSRSPYFREPLTIKLGFIDDDGDFLEFHCDARRFEPWDGAA